MKPPEVVLIQDDGMLLPLRRGSHASLLAERRDPTLPEFVREAVEAELLKRLDLWAMGVGNV